MSVLLPLKKEQITDCHSIVGDTVRYICPLCKKKKSFIEKDPDIISLETNCSSCRGRIKIMIIRKDAPKKKLGGVKLDQIKLSKKQKEIVDWMMTSPCDAQKALAKEIKKPIIEGNYLSELSETWVEHLLGKCQLWRDLIDDGQVAKTASEIASAKFTVGTLENKFREWLGVEE